MANTTIEVNQIIYRIESKESIDVIRNAYTPERWVHYSKLAYDECLARETEERKQLVHKKHVAFTSVETVESIIQLNQVLADYGIGLPIFVTNPEYERVLEMSQDLPSSQSAIIKFIGDITFNPRLRALQGRGRFQALDCFKPVATVIDAATLCYYRGNYVSSYLTLVPVVEGVILRWMGYTLGDKKAEFEEIKKFFKKGYSRQPSPYNIHFYDIFSRVCDKIVNEHFYKRSTEYDHESLFNRHLASHMLTDCSLGNEENCIRIFNLLDLMSEIYILEKRAEDPRNNILNEQIQPDMDQFVTSMYSTSKTTPEQYFLHRI